MIYTNKQNLPRQVAERSKGHNVREFIDGMRAAKEGKPHSQGHSDSFTAGYAAQYEMEQIMSEVFGGRFN